MKVLNTEAREDRVNDGAREPGDPGKSGKSGDPGKPGEPGASHPGRGRIEATRRVMLRDFLIFQMKLLLDGAKDVLVFNLSIGAVLLDLLGGKGRRRRLFYGLMEWSERFDLWINLHGPASRSGRTADGLFGASAAGSDTLLGKLELWTRGGDTPRSDRGGGPDPEGAAGGGSGPGRPQAA